jgi:hypothetical protein
MTKPDDKEALRTHISKVSLKAVLKRLPPGWSYSIGPQPSAMPKNAREAEDWE